MTWLTVASRPDAPGEKPSQVTCLDQWGPLSEAEDEEELQLAGAAVSLPPFLRVGATFPGQTRWRGGEGEPSISRTASSPLDATAVIIHLQSVRLMDERRRDSASWQLQGDGGMDGGIEGWTEGRRGP